MSRVYPDAGSEYPTKLASIRRALCGVRKCGGLTCSNCLYDGEAPDDEDIIPHFLDVLEKIGELDD